MKKLILGIIHFYQKFISPLTPPTCRFYPSCSHYGVQAIERFGVLKGGWLTGKRLLKCHPFHSGGLDSVPNKDQNH
jgi:putative membrane protein insertion efficiency factor